MTPVWPLHFSRLPILADIEGIPLEREYSNWVVEIPEELIQVVSEIAILDGGCWLVGGAVRELLSGNDEKTDWDLATTIPPLELSSHLESLGQKTLKVILTGVKYGTITVIWAGVKIEITTLRTDASYSDGRRPEEVFFGTSLKEDLERRDFTINSMAIDLARGILYDPHGGFTDLKNMKLRAVGDARRRIAEDGLRLLRAYRFIDRGNQGLLNLDEELHNALLKEQWMIDKISKERIWSEFQRILQGHHAGEIIWLMAKHQMLDQLFNQKFSVENEGIKAQSELILHNEKIRPEFRLSLLYFNRDSEDLEKACKRLSLSKKQRNSAHFSHKMLGRPPSNEDRGMMRLWRHLLSSSYEAQLLMELALSRHIGTELKLQSLVEELTELPPLKAGRLPLVTGDWLMEKTGIGKGEKLGRLKDWLHRLQIERDVANLEEMSDIFVTISWDYGDYLEWPKVKWFV